MLTMKIITFLITAFVILRPDNCTSALYYTTDYTISLELYFTV